MNIYMLIVSFLDKWMNYFNDMWDWELNCSNILLIGSIVNLYWFG